MQNAFPAIIVLTMLPISISGIGVREVSFAYFFSHVGVSNEQAVSISLAVFLLILIGNLGGGLLILKENLIVRRG